MARDLIIRARRVVVKIGTRIVTREDNRPSEEVIHAVTVQIREHLEGRQFILVSSGAIAFGLGRLGLEERPREINLLQAAAALGQSRMMFAYESAFEGSGHEIAQMLLTREDIQDRKRYLNIRNTIFTLWERGALPIVNENDSVSFDEIRFGDNDLLAAHLANMIDADLLLILTDTAGVYDRDPRRFPDARIILEIPRITDEIREGASGRGSRLSSGGMESKIRAAEIAVKSGVGVIIASGRALDLGGILEGREIGTYFIPWGKRIRGRKKWIAFNPRVEGTLVIDRGGERAIVEEKKSLLPAGIREVKGTFRMGGNLSIVNLKGREVARGLSNFSSDALRRI
ncbi:MAG: glutamate 5-kinase, partial [Spirochaetota bacterium]